MKVNKKIIGLGLATLMFCTQAMPVLAATKNSIVQHTYISQVDLDNATPASKQAHSPLGTMNMKLFSSQSKKYSIPGNKGTLKSNAWRQSGNGTVSGNSLQWDYQVSAYYSGSYAVETIRTTWQGSASLRNSAAINLGISDSGVSAGVSSSWQYVPTVAKYYENSNGSKSSSYRSNMVVTPKADYRKNTITIVNTAKVKLKVDAKPYQITASS